MNIEQCSPQIQDAFDVFLLDAESRLGPEIEYCYLVDT